MDRVLFGFLSWSLILILMQACSSQEPTTAIQRKSGIIAELNDVWLKDSTYWSQETTLRQRDGQLVTSLQAPNTTPRTPHQQIEVCPQRNIYDVATDYWHLRQLVTQNQWSEVVAKGQALLDRCPRLAWYSDLLFVQAVALNQMDRPEDAKIFAQQFLDFADGVVPQTFYQEDFSPSYRQTEAAQIAVRDQALSIRRERAQSYLDGQEMNLAYPLSESVEIARMKPLPFSTPGTLQSDHFLLLPLPNYRSRNLPFYHNDFLLMGTIPVANWNLEILPVYGLKNRPLDSSDLSTFYGQYAGAKVHLALPGDHNRQWSQMLIVRLLHGQSTTQLMEHKEPFSQYGLGYGFNYRWQKMSRLGLVLQDELIQTTDLPVAHTRLNASSYFIYEWNPTSRLPWHLLSGLVENHLAIGVQRPVIRLAYDLKTADAAISCFGSF